MQLRPNLIFTNSVLQKPNQLKCITRRFCANLYALTCQKFVQFVRTCMSCQKFVRTYLSCQNICTHLLVLTENCYALTCQKLVCTYLSCQIICTHFKCNTCLDRKWGWPQQKAHTWAASGEIFHTTGGQTFQQKVQIFFGQNIFSTMDFINVFLSPEKALFSSKIMLNFCHKRFFCFVAGNPIACMVMCRPTYISGLARNGSIPPITLTDGPGQGYTHYVLHLKITVETS